MLKKLLLSTFLFCACTSDFEPPLDEDTDEQSFRQGPSVLYLSQYEFNGGPAEFAQLVTTCENAGPLKVAVTFTEYPPPVTGSLDRVIGLGFSALASKEVAECYREVMLKLGAHP